ncbi:uracil-DNA glycosylase [Cryptococcus sp. DSM 104549]
MPPTRSIASYFIKPAPKPPASAAQATSSASVASASSSTIKSSTTATASSSSAPSKKSSGLSDATSSLNTKREVAGASTAAGEEGEEPAKKKSKVVSASAIATKPKTVKDDSPPFDYDQAMAFMPKRATNKTEVWERLPLHHLEAEMYDFVSEQTMGEDWLLALQDELFKPYFFKIKQFLDMEMDKKRTIFPEGKDIYSWSRLCPLKDVRIVIIGQDPYHDDGQAHGLAFSVQQGVKIPPSLRNIYKELTNEIPGWVSPKHGDLTEWAKHGILLLNTSLTVRAHEAGSHSKIGWDRFTAAVLKVVTDRLAPDSGEGAGGKGVVFMAWGAHAAKMCAGVDTKKHLVLRSAHPSPLSASRGFFGNGHFLKANEWLEERYGPGGGIDWKSLGAGKEAA